MLVSFIIYVIYYL